jgi:hypothetical protein
MRTAPPPPPAAPRRAHVGPAQDLFRKWRPRRKSESRVGSGRGRPRNGVPPPVCITRSAASGRRAKVASSDGIEGEGGARENVSLLHSKSFPTRRCRQIRAGVSGRRRESPVRSSNIERGRHRSQVERRGRLVGDPSVHVLNAASLVSTLDATAEKAYVEHRIFEEIFAAQIQLLLWQGLYFIGPTA